MSPRVTLYKRGIKEDLDIRHTGRSVSSLFERLRSFGESTVPGGAGAGVRVERGGRRRRGTVTGVTRIATSLSKVVGDPTVPVRRRQADHPGPMSEDLLLLLLAPGPLTLTPGGSTRLTR